MQSAEWERLWRNRFQGVFEKAKILKTEIKGLTTLGADMMESRWDFRDKG